MTGGKIIYGEIPCRRAFGHDDLIGLEDRALSDIIWPNKYDNIVKINGDRNWADATEVFDDELGESRSRTLRNTWLRFHCFGLFSHTVAPSNGVRGHPTIVIACD